MRVSKLLGKRLPEPPRDAQTAGHKILARGGYIRQVGAGIYTLLPLAYQATQKIEAIIREEMDRIGCQELLMPVSSPATLWQESGRYDSVGEAMVKFQDRNEQDYVLNMTHEEVVVDAVRANLDSYKQMPLAVYQIQTKFRDEARSRGGLIRVREFTMKDAYSFHRDHASLVEFYEQAHAAYVRIFQRCGLKNFVDIESDSGMMGGAVAHEFMAVSPVGEDTIFLCEKCDYRANKEIAVTNRVYPEQGELESLTEVETPGMKTIEEVVTFLGKTAQDSCKAVAFMEIGGEERPIVCFIRGDLNVSYAKVRNHVKARDLRPMEESEFAKIGCVAGYTGPLGLKECIVVYDESVAKSPNLVIGANKENYHTTGFNLSRDLPGAPTIDVAEVEDGDACPKCGASLRAHRGIEIGNIFQLGTKYTEAMGFSYNEEDGSQNFPTMGCYGIGVGRTFQSVAEESHDDYGPVWPISIAPYQAQICCVQAKKAEVLEAGERLYNALQNAGVEVLLDDRPVSPGSMFADADLIAAPVRAVVSPRNLKENKVELKYRVRDLPEDFDLPSECPIDEAHVVMTAAVQKLLSLYQG